MKPPLLLALVDLVQDIDVLLPVLTAVRQEPRLRLRIVVSRWLLRETTRLSALFRDRGLMFVTERRHDIVAGRRPSLRGVDAVLLASESTELAHAAGHRLALQARHRGLPAYAMQHGVEFAEPGRAPPQMASSVLFCWGDWASRQAGLMGPRPVIVGRPLEPVATSPDFDLGVFENLHWSRFTDAERARFLENLRTLASLRSELRILVRAHPAGGWLDAFGESLGQFRGVTFESSVIARASLNSGQAACARAARVLTTPSTVALDAALAGRPVALVLEGGEAYAGLPLALDPEQWLAFSTAPPVPPPEQGRFIDRHVRAGPAAERLVAEIISDLSRA